jgi:Tol biopolymer transport system component
MSVGTGETKKLTDVKSDEGLNPIWSPDNNTIYFMNLPFKPGRSRKIWEVTIKDGTTKEIIAFMGQGVGWTHQSLVIDKQKLYFTKAQSSADIWTAQLEYR